MTDTVKLIIEIPKDYYEVMTKTEVIMTSPRSGKTFMSIIYSAVAHGISLDDVKAEIAKEENIWYHDCEPENGWKKYDVIRVNTVLEILDNIVKAESEDKK